jgi:hypothetical protein
MIFFVFSSWIINEEFKVNAFPFKNKDKSYIFQTKATFTSCSAAPCLFCFEAICDRYFFKLNCFKLIGWFNHHNVFPPIRSVCYRFLHCDYRILHCCLGLTALKSTYHSRVISLCTRVKLSHLAASFATSCQQVVLALLVPSCQQVWNKPVTTCNNLILVLTDLLQGCSNRSDTVTI